MAANEEVTVVWGGGAIGGVVAARLAQAGHPVLMVDVAREHVEAVNAKGLEIVGPDGRSETIALRACVPEDMRGSYRQVMLSVKGQHTAEATHAIAPHLAADGWVLALQNGLTEQTIAREVGRERTLGALVNFASDYIGPGRIQFGGLGSLQVGEIDGRDTPRSRKAAELLQCVDPTAAWTGQLLGYKWSKVALGAVLFTTAQANDTIVELLSAPEFEPLWRALCTEVVAVARANGVEPAPFDGFAPEAFAAGASAAQARERIAAMAEHCRRWVGKPRSGVWRDLAVRKRRTELDPQITDVVAYAAPHGIATPTIDRLIVQIREMEAGTRGFDRANLFEMMAVHA